MGSTLCLHSKCLAGLKNYSDHVEARHYPTRCILIASHRTPKSERHVHVQLYCRPSRLGALTVAGVSVIVFPVLRILPGDPLVAVFGAEGFAKLSEAERAHDMAELG